MCRRVFNFSAGPSVIPATVLARAQRELKDWSGTGISMLETPFTGYDFKHLMQQTQNKLRELLAVPDNYRILFMHGGASAQFSLIPLNFLGSAKSASFIETGYWSKKAAVEAARYSHIHLAGSSLQTNFDRMPLQAELHADSQSAYCHMTSNETANGVQFHYVPDVGKVPLIADMTSDILTRDIDIGRYGVIYASSQKNISSAGFALVIVREDLFGLAHPLTPAMFNYQLQSEANSLLNTPVTFAIYLADLVFQWVIDQGGIAEMERRSVRRSHLLYQLIDESDGFYRCPIQVFHRSRVNVCFTLLNQMLTVLFLQEAEKSGLVNLKGHAMMGGVRASLYNAMSDDGVNALVKFMREFRNQYAHV
jgi:phosphoserine aminotransferase